MQPVLQERMMRYSTSRLSFSLLALCGDNLTPIRHRLATNIHHLASLHTKFNTTTTPTWPPPDPNTITTPTDPRLATYQLSPSDINTTTIPTPTAASPTPQEPPNPSSNPTTEAETETETIEPALALLKEYTATQALLRTEYDTELALSGQEPSTAFGRTKDHTAAVHAWVGKLAGHGVLRGLWEEVEKGRGA
jgi:ubiquitin carboxyl-terminal hydrolase L5